MAAEYRNRVEAIRDLTAAVHAANIAVSDYMKSAFPVGSEVRWMHGRHEQAGIVVKHGYADKMLVENFNTERKVWIDAAKMLNVWGPSNG